MARVVDLTGENVTRQRRKERNFGTKTDLPSTSVERGNTHWTDGSNVNIDGFLGVAGTMTVSGVLSVTGTFNASGSINLSGSTSVTGPLDITGATTIGGSLDVTGPTNLDGVLTINGDTSITGLLTITGDTTISGMLDIDGVTTLNNDLNVTNDGQIKVGTAMTLTPLTGGGSLLFDNGTGLTSTGTAASLYAGTSGVSVSGSGVEINAGAGSIFELMADNTWVLAGGGGSLIGESGSLAIGYNTKIDLNAPATNVSGNLKVSGTSEVIGFAWFRGRGFYLTDLPSTANPPNLHITSGGQVYRSTWTP